MSGAAVARVVGAYGRIAETDRSEAWIHLRPKADVEREAAAIDARVDAGERLPLAGTVFAVKDNIDVAGLPTTAACAPFAYTPTQSSPAVARLVAAGALVLGKTNLDQFATGLVGTRSPFGAVRGALLPERISGGSSSGSAVVVALGIADFALGTDTAGSGRVPAMFNGIVGVKPTVGLIPTLGVVAACRSYDCVSVFAPTLAAAQLPLRTIIGPDSADHRGRVWPLDVPLAAPAAPVIAVPDDAGLAPVSADARAAFTAAVRRLGQAGATITAVDISPLLDAARLLYEGALVAERYEAFGAFLEEHPEAADPSVLSIVRSAREVAGADVIRDQDRVLAYRRVAARLFDGVDALLVPTTTDHPDFAEVAADPIGVNSRLGTYTNFVNLLDLCAVSVPAGEADGGPFGVTVIAPAFHDQPAVDIASHLLGSPGAGDGPALPAGIPLVVFGAHLRGLPLNGQLTALGARFVREVRTAPRYRMHVLPGDPARPAVRLAGDSELGVALAGEEWLLSPAALGRLTASLAWPMMLGPVELADGTRATGFGASEALGPDVSEHGGWRAYLAASRELVP
ncbi:allophanate hydrolase [Gryllotalpicola protaetiae]|uniref:Allophanate hydrolase n=1 Tax=Gryllotalpicola protaetiae TaxID=2419771 RepID=A0A387BLL4_9MICO|nr:allophanate hydrolase [Gryllotalpicola protaetiae]AYG03252.1 allophanate hydrolase [Gryllotalpicola protaetiae]